MAVSALAVMATSPSIPDVVEGTAEGEVTLDQRTPTQEVRFQLGPSEHVPAPARVPVTIRLGVAQLMGPLRPVDTPVDLQVVQTGPDGARIGEWVGTNGLTFDANTAGACPSISPDHEPRPCALAFRLTLTSPGAASPVAITWRASAVAFSEAAASRAPGVGTARGVLPTDPAPPIAPEANAWLAFALISVGAVTGGLLRSRRRASASATSAGATGDTATYVTQVSLAALVAVLAFRIARLPNDQVSDLSTIVAGAIGLLAGALLAGVVALWRGRTGLLLLISNGLVLFFVVPLLAWIVVHSSPSVAAGGAVLVGLMAGASSYGVVAGALADLERRSALSATVVVVHAAIAAGCMLAATGVLTAKTTGTDPGTLWGMTSVFLLPGIAVAFGVFDWVRGGRAPLVLADLAVCFVAVPLMFFLTGGLGLDDDAQDNVFAVVFLLVAVTGILIAARAVTVEATPAVRPITSRAAQRPIFRAHGIRSPKHRGPTGPGD